MKRILIVVSILFISCETKLAKNGQINSIEQISDIQANLIFDRAKVFPNNSQISISIVENGLARFYGVIRKNDIICSLGNKDSVFEIGSITKVFTSTLLVNAVVENKLKLGDSINDYLNFPLKDDTKITFQSLANHTSGLPKNPSNLGFGLGNPNSKYRYYDEEKLKKYLTEGLRLTYKPGERTKYSNLGAGVLGYTLCEVYEKDYESLILDKIFWRYQMKNSTSNINKIVPFLVRGLDENGNEVPNLDLSALVGAGGIFSTVEDLSKFVIAHFDHSNKELQLTLRKTFSIDEASDRGLSWRILRNPSSQPWYFHNGATPGYKSFLVMNTKTQNAIVILSNVSGRNKNQSNIDGLGFELMKTLE
ncbi:serine hydrolase [Ulvibacterium sp.]|uniref:serine hydrolase domain-containing protein n=1 Tax=Ulvibacterium sp. TaxID=2665914 RepID=UPI0026327F0A|nr:serine hydrolase domain-containing protein [Ulvibacterium sp.]